MEGPPTTHRRWGCVLLALHSLLPLLKEHIGYSEEEILNFRQIIGIVAIVIGIFLIVSASRSMDSTGQKIKQEFTGTYSKSIRLDMIGGIVLVVVGGGLLVYSRWKSS